MACEGNGMSDERIGTALITEVIEEELKDMPAEDVPHLASAKVKTEHEKKMVTQLGVMVRIIGDRMQDDQEFQDAVDGVAKCSGSKWDKFNGVAEKVFEHGITWERIAALFYVAGKLAVKMVEAHLPQSVSEILKWTIDFFKNKLLDWIREHGGWINSFSELAMASMQSVSSLSSQRVGLVIIFIAGLSLGSVITWRLTR
ncbi:putative apoptosis regulator BAX-like isoform 2 [Scophthalmus maximus]|uniref:Putative apoptosis regulator BAX-like isoform 2 n=3 Tax=Scophthalmus maximus TaxID=52904 RepID=A0A2U9CNX4_SCOMX|nr:putative apoptosis regulator BAX-like isoform 2 [Scophthalmus maximus]